MVERFERGMMNCIEIKQLIINYIDTQKINNLWVDHKENEVVLNYVFISASYLIYKMQKVYDSGYLFKSYQATLCFGEKRKSQDGRLEFTNSYWRKNFSSFVIHTVVL